LSWLRRLLREHWNIIIPVLVTVAGLALYALTSLRPESSSPLAFIANLELRTLDARFQLRGARTPDARIVIVGIDENTLRRVGAFPIPRSAYATLVDRLHAAGAKVVAFDATFPSPEKNSALDALKTLERETADMRNPAVIARIRELERTSDNDLRFAESIKRAGNVILGHIFLDREKARDTDPKVAEDYYNILWGQAFPQVLKVKDKGPDFNLQDAWANPAHGGGQMAWGIEPNIRLLAEAAQSYGFINSNPDPDGTFRRATLLIRYQDLDYFGSLDFQAVKAYYQIPDQQLTAFIGRNGLERIEFGSHRLLTNGDGTMLINYAGPYHTYPHYSMVDVIEGKAPVAVFRDAIVLVGPTALGIGDLRNTPFESSLAYMGVEIHANIIDNLLHVGNPGRSFLTRTGSQQALDVGFILVLGLGLGFLFGRTRPVVAVLAAIVALLIFSIVVELVFGHWGMWLSFVVPAGTLVAGYGAITSFRMVLEEREKRKIRKSFSQYVSPAVIRLLEQDPDRYFRPGGELKQLTVMFSDIRGFTAISEAMTPNELVSLLNRYLDEMTDIIFRHWGTLDKYIGDAIMAFWGSPLPREDHAYLSCACALDMQSRLRELNREWEKAGREPLSIGVGVNTGMMNVGNMGSMRRLAWTVMGDNVNLASRLEGLNKKYRTGIIISESTYAQLNGQFVCRQLDQIRVKGKLQPVKIYELLAYAGEAKSYSQRLQEFQTALEAYRVQAWSDAIERFESLLSRFPDDGPAHEFLRRSHEFRNHPPALDWDGVYVMETK
jgi:adenylate cyclase